LRRAKQQAGPHCGRAPVTPTLLRQPGSQAPSRNERPRAHPNGRHPTPGRRPARAPAGRPFAALWRPVATRTQRGRGCRRGWRRSATSGAGPGCPPPPSPRVRDILGASAVAPVAPALGGQALRSFCGCDDLDLLEPVLPPPAAAAGGGPRADESPASGALAAVGAFCSQRLARWPPHSVAH